MIEWVDETGYYFVDDKALETAKRKGVAYLRISETYQNETVKGLPTPFDLTGDPRWNEGGDLLKLYDLELEKRTLSVRCLPVFTLCLPPHLTRSKKMKSLILFNILVMSRRVLRCLDKFRGVKEKILRKPRKDQEMAMVTERD